MLVPREIATHAPFPFGENLLINGDFSVWQRGDSWPSIVTETYTADRWKSRIENGATGAFNRIAFAAGDEASSGSVFYAQQSAVTTPNAGSYNILTQYMEDVRTAAGRKVTVQFQVASTSAGKVFIEVEQQFGAGGSPAVLTPIETIDVSAGFSYHEATFTVPDVAGKTIGTDSALAFNFWLSAGANFDARSQNLGVQVNDFYFSNVKLEYGAVATPFIARQYQQEISLCQRYYSTIDADWQHQSVSGYQIINTGYLPVQMRDVPTVTYETAYSNNLSSIVFYGTGNTALRCEILPTTAGVPVRWLGAIKADAELFK